MNKFILLNALVTCCIFIIGYSSYSQTDLPLRLIEVKATPMDTTKGDYVHFRGNNPVNDQELPPPSEMGGSNSKGITCEVKFENRTGFVVDVYIDGHWQGTIGAWGDAVYRNISGYTTIYCMTVGRTFEWLTKGDCDVNYLYKLTKESSGGK